MYDTGVGQNIIMKPLLQAHQSQQIKLAAEARKQRFLE